MLPSFSNSALSLLSVLRTIAGVTAVENSAPLFRHLEHRISDPDTFGLVLPGTEMTVDFLQAQRLPARAEQFQTMEWSLEFYETHLKGRVRGPMPPGWGCVGLARSPSESQWHQLPAAEGILVCIPPEEAMDGRIAPGFACASVYVPPEVWERCRRLAGAERELYGGTAAHRLHPQLYASVERQLRYTRSALHAAVADPRHAASALRDAALYVSRIITMAWEFPVADWRPRESQRNRARLARRAEAWMLDRLAEPVQVADVCLALGVSRRELEYAFRSAFDQSPRDHLQALRLNAVHRALCRADGASDTVIRVALDHGITHLGRFAAQYRMLFGESPSATLRW